MATQDDYVRITLRIPKALHTRLTTAAEDTSKSTNAEILARLQESFDPKRYQLGARTEREAVAQVLTEMYTETVARIAAFKSHRNLSAMDQIELQHEEETAKYLRHAAARAAAAVMDKVK